MSYIDVYKHELVGLFGALPVYHPLEDIGTLADPADYDFGCSPNQLVLGGGSGEHPGLVLVDPNRAVAEFLVYSPDFKLTQKQKKHCTDLAMSSAPKFHFAGWASDDHHRFFEICTQGSLPNPFSKDGETDFETWLHLGFGEFIYFSFPALAGALMSELGQVPGRPLHMYYNNILVVPPNIPVYANGGNVFFKRKD